MPPRAANVLPVVSKRAPKAVGNYSIAVTAEANQVLYVSGQIPIEMPKGTVFTGDIKKQAEIVMTNLRNVILDAKFTMEDVVKCTIYLTNMEHYEVVNEVYGKAFISKVFPARAIVGVASLPKGVSVEIEAIAVKKADGKDNAGRNRILEEMIEEY